MNSLVWRLFVKNKDLTPIHTAGFEDTHHVLDKVKLFVAGGDGEVIPVGCLVSPLGAKWGIGHDAIIGAALFGFIDGIT